MAEAGAAVATSSGGGCCGCIGFLLLLTGGIMYGLCLNAVERNVCDQNEQYEQVGFILMMVGAGIEGLSVLICLCMCCIGGGIICCSICEDDGPCSQV